MLLLGLSTGPGTLTSIAGESPDKVTTDTLSYCRDLSDRVERLMDASSNPPQSATDLSIAGKDMCERGSIRAGIMRLRSAMVLLLHQTSVRPAVQMGRTN